MPDPATFAGAAFPGLAIAFACGLLLGIEREHRKSHGPTRRHAGVRSFALAALTGALGQWMGQGLLIMGAMLVLVLAILAKYIDRKGEIGITTELALFLSFLLGAAAMIHAGIAAAVTVVVAATLNLRNPLHHFARVSLRPQELRAALVLAGAALVVRPLLPETGPAWMPGVHPKSLWTLFVLILAIQAAAHLALRVAGARLGLAAAGFAAGFVSSVASVAAMGARCKTDPVLRHACVCAALFSNIATYLLLWVVALTVAPAHLDDLWPELASGTTAALLVALFSLNRSARQTTALPDPAASVIRIGQAAVFALGLGVASAGIAFLQGNLGARMAAAATAVAGFFDVHAASASALSLLASGAADPRNALLAVLLAISTNTFSKIVAALVGGWRYALHTGASLALVLFGTWLPYWL